MFPMDHKNSGKRIIGHDQDVSESLLQDDFPSPTNEQSSRHCSSSFTKRPRLYNFLYNFTTYLILLVFTLLVFWQVFVPSPTQLQYQVLTADNKSFPSGQLLWSPHFEPLPCGKSPQEAMARGCHFDMIATAWLPSKCIDHELVNEFLAVADWHFYTEFQGTTKLSTYEPDVLGAHTATIWTSRRWHVVHCLYMFKKLNRAVVNGWAVDAETIAMPHTEHCSKVIERQLTETDLDLDEIETYLEIIYPPC